MRKIVVKVLLSLSVLGVSVFAEEYCESGMCGDASIENPGAKEGEYRVLSPVGAGSVKVVTQGPRLDTLDGKTIAVVGGSFMASVTHPEIKRLILDRYPTAKVLLLHEIGAAGPWPGPGVVRWEKEEFQRKLKEYEVHAVISGNGGCGLCTPKEMGSCIAAEYLGIPTVMIAAPGFVNQARSAARTAGIPIPRVVEYPGAFTSHSREELLSNTREILWPRIVEALTQPLTLEESDAGIVDNSAAEIEIVFTGDIDEINRHFSDNGWTDGLPIIPPTQERVAAFLKYTDLAPDTVIAELPVAYRKVTALHVAVNGVMAGCPPEFMPILVAFTQAMAFPDFRRTLSSTHAWTPFCWLNGPLARQLQIDCGQGEISARRNALIGRFINLAMLNLGGYYIKENRMGSFGYLMPWCLAEDDAAVIGIGWRPWHMQQGYQLNDNTLTAGSALSWGNNLSPATSDPLKIMELMAWDCVEKQQFAFGSGTPFVYRTILITQQVARDLALRYSKESLEEALISEARRPLLERAYANYWGNPGSAVRHSLAHHVKIIGDSEKAEVTRIPPWLAWTGKETLETVPVIKEGKTALLVTGDAGRNKTMCIPGGGFATVKIVLPANWDELTNALGYQPLSSFRLPSDLQPIQAPERGKRVRDKSILRPLGNDHRPPERFSHT